MGLECNVRDLREDKGWSLSQLARIAGLNKGRVSEIERGIRRFTREEKHVLENVLGFAVRQWVSLPPWDEHE